MVDRRNPLTSSVKLEDSETRSQMINTAVRLIGESGLTVGVDHLRYEAVIQEARVARSAAYRLWRTKEAFFDDVLCELAGVQWQGTGAFDQETLDTAVIVFADRVDDLATVEGRRSVWIEAARQGAQRNFESLAEHKHWRTYVALTATVLSLPEEESFRARLEEALQAGERRALSFMGEFYRSMGALAGFRLRPEFGDDYTALAGIGAAVVEGLGLRQFIVPSVAEKTYRIAPFAGSDVQDWGLAALGFTAILLTMIEPDPNFTSERLPEIKDQLRAARSDIQRRQASESSTEPLDPDALHVLGHRASE